MENEAKTYPGALPEVKPTRTRPGFLDSRFYRLINFYPPFLGAGIQVLHTSPDRHTVRVRLKMAWFNRNAVGTHFGGSLYAMCDPFFMLMLMHHLGPEYIVWDKAASIQFRRPGRGAVYAEFHISPEQVAEIRARADAGEKLEPTFEVDVVDEAGQVVAHVSKLLYVRRKESGRGGEAGR